MAKLKDSDKSYLSDTMIVFASYKLTKLSSGNKVVNNVYDNCSFNVNENIICYKYSYLRNLYIYRKTIIYLVGS